MISRVIEKRRLKNICSISMLQKNSYNSWRDHTKGSTIGKTNQQHLKYLFSDEYDGFILTDHVNENTGEPLPPA